MRRYVARELINRYKQGYVKVKQGDIVQRVALRNEYIVLILPKTMQFSGRILMTKERETDTQAFGMLPWRIQSYR